MNAGLARAHDDMVIVEEIRADVLELRRIAFNIEDALEKTSDRYSMDRGVAAFVKKALLDHADNLDLQ